MASAKHCSAHQEQKSSVTHASMRTSLAVMSVYTGTVMTGDIGMRGDQCCCAGCSAQYCDDDGSWVPVAVKVMPYAAPEEVNVVNREISAMKAMKGKSHPLVSVLSQDSHAVDGVPKKVVVMRYISAFSRHIDRMVMICNKYGFLIHFLGKAQE